jgi:hypothetical protein
MVVDVLVMLPNAEVLAGVLEMKGLARVQGFQLRGHEFCECVDGVSWVGLHGS